MAAAARKPRAGVMILALPMLLFGAIMLGTGYVGLGEWRSEGSWLIACNLVLLGAGLPAVCAALWMLGSLGRSPWALRVGGAAILVTGTVMIAGVLLGVLLCTGPA